MKSNFEYIKEFINKHNYNSVIHVYPQSAKTTEDIQGVIFNEEDIKNKYKISLSDIIYDIESSLPKDVFFRYLEYLDKGNNVSYIYWMTKMDNQYKPMGIDKSESEKIKKLIYKKIDEIKHQTWF